MLELARQRAGGVINQSKTRDTPCFPLAAKGRLGVWNSHRGNHLGQRSCASAKTGRTYGRKRSDQSTAQITLRGGGRALTSPDLVLGSQPPAQPHSRVVVERAIGFAGGADTEVIGPPAKRAVQHVDELCGLLPAARSVGQRVDSFDHALDALL